MNNSNLNAVIEELSDIAAGKKVKNINSLLTIMRLLKSLDNSIEDSQNYLDAYFGELTQIKQTVTALGEVINSATFRSMLSELSVVYDDAKEITNRTYQLEQNNSSLLEAVEDLNVSGDQLISRALNGYVKTIRENENRRKIADGYGEE